MKNSILSILTVLALLIVTTTCVNADMSSANYRITTSVMSGGGGVMGSSGFQLNGTLGQPSPLIDDPLFPPFSTSFELYSGFWYTVGVPLVPECAADLNGDGVVDEDDLILLAPEFGLTPAGLSVDDDSDMDGLDLFRMVLDMINPACSGP
jgi:hypothetical protein